MSEYSDYIWAYLYAKTGNEYGTAGLMGNLQAESGLIPYRLQGDFSSGYTASIRYTNGVDSGTITENTFEHDQKGYGLAQWTIISRKTDMYTYWQNNWYPISIGNVDFELDYLYHDLTVNYPSVWSVLVSATSVDEASDKVLYSYEAPSDPDSKKAYRRSLGQAIYNEYAGGGPPTPPTPPGPPAPPTSLEIPIWMLFKFPKV